MSASVTPISDYANLKVVKRNGDGGGGDSLEARVARLESDIKHIQQDATEIKQDIKSISSDIVTMKIDVAQTKTSITWVHWVQGVILAAIIAGYFI